MTTAGHVFGYQVDDHPDVWLRVIAPQDDLHSLLAHLQEQFHGRLRAVRNEAEPAAVIAVASEGSRRVAPAAPVPSTTQASWRLATWAEIHGEETPYHV